MRNLDSCRCWWCRLCPCKVRNKFLVKFWNCSILLCIPCICVIFAFKKCTHWISLVTVFLVSQNLIYNNCSVFLTLLNQHVTCNKSTDTRQWRWMSATMEQPTGTPPHAVTSICNCRCHVTTTCLHCTIHLPYELYVGSFDHNSNRLQFS
jgi:hypothetical protein